MGRDDASAPPGEFDHISPDLRALARHVDELEEDPDNANTHDARSLAEMAASLRRFGQRKAFVVRVIPGQEKLRLEAGHGGLAAARSLGWTHVAVSREYEDEASARAFGIVDNRTAQFSAFDPARLGAQLGSLEDLGFATPADLGFAQEELAALGIVGAVGDAELPDLPTGDRAPFQQRKFNLHDSQASVVDEALDAATKAGLIAPGPNTNANGNALYAVCAAFLRSRA